MLALLSPKNVGFGSKDEFLSAALLLNNFETSGKLRS